MTPRNLFNASSYAFTFAYLKRTNADVSKGEELWKEVMSLQDKMQPSEQLLGSALAFFLWKKKSFSEVEPILKMVLVCSPVSCTDDGLLQ